METPCYLALPADAGGYHKIESQIRVEELFLANAHADKEQVYKTVRRKA
jgi:hypothetical protein